MQTLHILIATPKTAVRLPASEGHSTRTVAVRPKRSFQGAALLIFIAIAAVGCVYPVKVSSGCQAQINQCLLNCDATPHDPSEFAGSQENRILTDHRSPCEQQCHTLCHD
ncbi:MAG: hypothetical protein JXX14_21250 [Deltaproteobacteria bacterium]|nr:hypothetical protein [Deltaproteobacteria bacterium]